MWREILGMEAKLRFIGRVSSVQRAGKAWHGTGPCTWLESPSSDSASLQRPRASFLPGRHATESSLPGCSEGRGTRPVPFASA